MVRRDIDRRPAASCRHCHGLWISGPAIAETQLPVDHVPIESRRAGPMRPDARPRLPNRPAPPNTRAPLRADWSAFDALTEATIALLPMFFDG